MANKTLKAAMMFLAGMIMFNSCDKEGLTPMESSTGYTSNAGKKVVKVTDPDDKIISYTYTDAFERFVEGGTEYSFIPVTVYEKKGEVKGERIFIVDPFNHKGIEAQYQHQQKEDTLKTSFGAATTIHEDLAKTAQEGWWKEVSGKVQNFSATNGANVVAHNTTTTAASMVYRAHNDSLVVEFPAPSFTLSESTSHSDVTGVSYEGKSYSALRYASDVKATLSIAEAFRKAGESSTKELVATNVAFLLKHEVKTDVEGLKYEANFISNANKVVTDYQYVDFALVTRDNGEIKANVPYRLDMNLFTTLSNVEDVEVYSEAALVDEKVTYTRGNVSESSSSEDIFTKTAYSFADNAVMTDSRVVNVTGGYEKYLWGTYAFPFASIVSREASVKATLNAAESTASKKVADVVYTETIVIGFNGVNRANETKTASVTYKRFYNVPDNYTKSFEAQEYVGEFAAKEGTFATNDQHNKYVRKTYNNGVLTEEKSFEMPLVLSAKIVRTSEARKSIDEVKNLTVSMTPNGADKTTFGTADENGYRAQRVTTNHTLRVSDGSTYNLEIVTENTVKDGKDEFDYAWFDAIEPVISLQPKLNSAESTASNPVYDVNVSVNLNVARTTRGQVQTKAAADEKEPYTIMASHQEVMTVADELVSSREEKVVTPKTNGFDIVARFFETYSLSGERMVSEQKGEMLFDINGSNGTAMVVKNVNFTTTGNGLNGTGNGTYSDNASNGTDSFNNTYSYSADNSKSLSYNGKTVTFTATFKIVENGQNIGSKTSSNGYDAYPYTNTVKGIYTVEGQSVEKTATATRELRIEKTDDLVSSREEKVVTPKTNGFDIVARFFETYSLSGERMVSEQKGEMLFDINGSNGTAMVVKNVNFNTTGNGLNSTGNGSYTDTASNGTDSFNNTYSYSADNSKSLSYNGKTVTFTATFKIVENGQNIGSKTSSNGYDAYPYSNAVKGIYTVEGQSVEKTATATRELRVAQEVENLIGDIVSAGMSVVPSLKSGSSYVDGSGKRVATKCLTIRRANGTAAAIVFAYETETNVVIPTDAQIKNGNWVSGNYNDAYNSGVFMNGNWVPAIAKDQSYGISYSIPTKNDIRSIRNETLKQWGWRSGNFSTVLSNYNVTVEDGVCTIYYNGEVVKRFR